MASACGLRSVQVLGLDLGVPGQHLPVSMAGDQCYLLDAVALLEQTGHALMAQVVKVQILDAERGLRAREDCANCIRLHREDPAVARQLGRPRLPLHDLERPAEQRHLLVVSDFLARVLPVPDNDRAVDLVQVKPSQLRDLVDTHGRFDRKVDDVAHRKRRALVEVVA